jgi:ethanolamine ammonia-lyase large subunit
LFVRYGGYTLAGVVKGTYRMRSGDKEVDESQEVWVAVDEAALDELRQLVGSFCRALGQEVMYFEVTDASVEFIGPEPEKGADK